MTHLATCGNKGLCKLDEFWRCLRFWSGLPYKRSLSWTVFFRMCSRFWSGLPYGHSLEVWLLGCQSLLHSWKNLWCSFYEAELDPQSCIVYKICHPITTGNSPQGSLGCQSLLYSEKNLWCSFNEATLEPQSWIGYKICHSIPTGN